MQPSPLGLIALVIVGLASFGALFTLPRFWRGELQQLHEHGSEKWWVWGAALRRGFLRSLHIGIVGIFGLVAGYFALLMVQSPGDPDSGRPVVVLLAVWFVLMVAAEVLVMLFNRPKFLVPPHARDQPGLIQGWLRHRHSSRS